MPLDAAVSGALIESIFYPKSPLHDGAVIVRQGRIVAACCMLPLTESTALSRELGTRHRAAIGVTERATPSPSWSARRPGASRSRIAASCSAWMIPPSWTRCSPTCSPARCRSRNRKRWKRESRPGRTHGLGRERGQARGRASAGLVAAPWQLGAPRLRAQGDGAGVRAAAVGRARESRRGREPFGARGAQRAHARGGRPRPRRRRERLPRGAERPDPAQGQGVEPQGHADRQGPEGRRREHQHVRGRSLRCLDAGRSRREDLSRAARSRPVQEPRRSAAAHVLPRQPRCAEGHARAERDGRDPRSRRPTSRSSASRATASCSRSRVSACAPTSSR